MYLIKLNLDLQKRNIYYAVCDCQKMHQLVLKLFGIKRAQGNILYRLNTDSQQICLYIYSDIPIVESGLRETCGVEFCGERDVSTWLSSMIIGKILRFNILTMPSKKVKREGRESQRRVLTQKEKRLEWLYKKADESGFAILDVQEIEKQHFSGHRAKSGTMHWDAYLYQGILQIKDDKVFQNAVRCGIGPGKAYGLGMLMLVL